MIKTILARLQQGHRAMPIGPDKHPPMPDRSRGRPRVDRARCPAHCRLCEEACSTRAIALIGGMPGAGAAPGPQVDLGRCLFCTDCSTACPHGALTHGQDHRLAARARQDLVCSGETPLPPMRALDEPLRKLLGRSLRLRQVSAGGCNACEADCNVLGTVGWDMGRFGIQFVASPRHADGLLITGPVTDNMKLALEKTYHSVPTPRIVIAVGSCAIAGGPYIDHPESHNGAESVVPVDLFIPGCPPHPLTILDGLLRLLGRM